MSPWPGPTGSPLGRIYWGAMKNALVPFVNYAGTHVPSFFSGFVVVETVFAYPGLGNMIVGAIPTKDYPVLMGDYHHRPGGDPVHAGGGPDRPGPEPQAEKVGDGMKRRKPHSNRFWVLLFLGIAALCLLSPSLPCTAPPRWTWAGAPGPGAAHWFGTDSLGRDVFARVLYGGMVSLGVAAVTTAAALLIGLVYGGVSGYVGGRVDNVMMRAVDVVYSIPSTIIVLAFQMVFPNQILGLIIIMSLTSWMTTARVIRGRFLELKRPTSSCWPRG